MKKIYFLLVFCVFLVSCQTPQNPESWMEMQKNACLPTAIAFREGLRKYNVWSEVIVYNYYNPRKNNKLVGHAIVAYMYPKGENTLWTYDYEGSYNIRAFKGDPFQIAQQSEYVRNRRYVNINSAKLLK